MRARSMGAWLGILLALGTAVAWGLGNVLTQRIGKRIGPPRALVWSMTAGALLTAPLALALDARTAPVTSGVVASVLVAGVAGVVAYVGLFYAFANEGLTVTVPMVSSWPLVSVASAVLVYGERLHGVKALGTAAVIAGVILVSIVPDAPSGATVDPRSRRNALVAAGASSLGFGVMVPTMARAAPATGTFGATVLVYLVAVLLVALVLGVLGRRSLAPPPRASWPLVLATGAAESTGFVMVSFAGRFAPLSIVVPVASLSSTLTVLYAWVVLRERPRKLTAFGALVACAGVMLLAR